jgi:hypothetical protein
MASPSKLLSSVNTIIEFEQSSYNEEDEMLLSDLEFNKK